MNNVGLEFAAKTDTGLVRSQNEDAITTSLAHGFAILADGMGGYNAGEVASSIAIAVTRSGLEEGLDRMRSAQPDASRQRTRQIHQLIAESIHGANTAVLEAARDEQAYSGMGTTLVTAVFHNDKLTIAHVGDSRAYRFREGEIEQITRDHSLLQEQIDAGLVAPEWARFSQHKNLVTRAVGVGLELEVEIHDHHIKPGDIYLLCSDGLSDLLQDSEIGKILKDRQASLEQACDALVQEANDHGGLDNISAILIKVLSTGTETRSLLDRVLNWVS